MKLVFDNLDKEISNVTAFTDVKIDFWRNKRDLFEMVLYFDDKKIIHCIYDDVDEFNKYTTNILARLEKVGVDVVSILDSFGHM